MWDVAEEADVSLSTVSNVLNRPDIVAPDTQARVREAINRLKFVPNNSARQLRGGRSSTIGIVVFDLSNPYWGEVTAGAESALAETGFVLMVGSSDTSAAKEERILRGFDEHRPEGVLVASVRDFEELMPIYERGTPVVLLGEGAETLPMSYVGIDDRRGGQLGADHLFDLGHTRIGFVNGPVARYAWAERRRGVMDSIQSRGLDWGQAVLEITIETPSAREGDAVVDAMLQADPRPTALFCANDLVALGVLRRFAALGMHVREDCAIVGFDDIEVAALLSPPLTSIRVPAYELGRRAAQILIDQITNPGTTSAQHVHFQPELIVRESSFGPRSDPTLGRPE
jgi:LacI family transcriptional regulator